MRSGVIHIGLSLSPLGNGQLRSIVRGFITDLDASGGAASYASTALRYGTQRLRPRVRSAHSKPHPVPACVHGFFGSGTCPKQFGGGRAGPGGELGHAHARYCAGVGHHVVPDLAYGFPAGPTHQFAGGAESEVERATGAVRILTGLELAMACGLGRNAVRAIGLRHVAQAGEAALAGEPADDVAANQPIRACRILLEPPLAKHGAEAVGQALVETAGLLVVFKLQRVLREAMRQLMADHIHSRSQVDEQLAIAIPVNHLQAVPHRIVVFVAIVHGGHQRHARSVDRVALEDFAQEGRHQSGLSESALHGFVLGLGRVLDMQAWQALGIAAIKQGDVRMRCEFHQLLVFLQKPGKRQVLVADVAKKTIQARSVGRLFTRLLRELGVGGKPLKHLI